MGNLYIIIHELNITVAQEQPPSDNTPPKPDEFVAICEHCGWKKTYGDAKSKNRGLSAHYHHCKGLMKTEDVMKSVDNLLRKKW